MLRRLRETGPAVLVPAIWTVVAGAHLGTVSEHTLLVAHAVMTALLLAFVGLSWGDMTEGVLRVWRGVILAGTPPAVAGTAGLLATPPVDVLLGVSVVAWLALPAPALWYTGRRVATYPLAYLAGGAASGLGAIGYVGAAASGAGTGPLVATVALAGIGQTAGIAAAVLDGQ